MSYIGWVQAGGAWALRVLPSKFVQEAAYCSCACCDLETLRLHFLAFHVDFLLVLPSNQKLGFV